MKKLLFCAALAVGAMGLAVSCKSKAGNEAEQPKLEVLTYVWCGDTIMPDPNLVTTINYAFGVVDSARTGVEVWHPERLRKMVALKNQNPDLKVFISLGGSAKDGFSEMAADSLKRMAFAGDIARVIEEYGLDGVDWDWEFPCGQGGRPDDYTNFAKLLRLTRDSIGEGKMMTIAAGGDMAGLDTNNIPELMRLFDYVNVMAYDLGGQAPWHHTALYRSPNTGWRSVDEVVADYVAHGVPYEKMMLGLGFYGRGDDHYYTGWTSTAQAQPYGNLTEQWDSIAMVPYIADSTGALVCGFENLRSIEIKCDYILDKGFRGAMCWRTELDLDSLPLARTVARKLRGVE